jgi:recombination protein RecT
MNAQVKNLPARQETNTIQAMLMRPAMRKQLEMAIPKHMTVDRLLRVAMTAIRTNPKLMECTQESLLACIMGCAQLGLEPEPFLGQAYLVPYKRNIKVGNQWRSQMEAQLIPGYRGYIAMARRSGEVQSVSAQVVYENDHFQIQYGLNEDLSHVPAEGDRGEVKGAYVVFRYKDGSHSFDYMSKADIDKIRDRSKAKDSGPWVTDYAEMAKKTVIRRHIKLVPLSVEMARAAAAENLAISGESQLGLFDPDAKAIPYEAEAEGEQPKPVSFWDRVGMEEGDMSRISDFLDAMAAHYKVDAGTIESQAAETDEAWRELMEKYRAWCEKHPEEPSKEYPPDHTGRNDRTGMGALRGETPPPATPPLTAYEEEARRCNDVGDVTDAMQAALEACELANMPTKTADKQRVGAVLLTLQAPDPA